MAEEFNVVLDVLGKASCLGSIHPIFNVVSTVANQLKGDQRLPKDKGNNLKKDFEKINTKLEEILERNKEFRKEILASEYAGTYGVCENDIENQYKAFSEMIKEMNTEKEKDEVRKDFEENFEKKGVLQPLKAYCDGLMGQNEIGSPLLDLIQELCNKNREKMERELSYITQILQKGFMASLAYKYIMNTDVDEFCEEWRLKFDEIQKKMAEVLEGLK